MNAGNHCHLKGRPSVRFTPNWQIIDLRLLSPTLKSDILMRIDLTERIHGKPLKRHICNHYPTFLFIFTLTPSLKSKCHHTYNTICILLMQFSILLDRFLLPFLFGSSSFFAVCFYFQKVLL